MFCMIGCDVLKSLRAKRLLSESVKMTLRYSSDTSIKHSALCIATNSAVKTVAWEGKVNDRVTGPFTNEHPTPPSVFDPSVKY